MGSERISAPDGVTLVGAGPAARSDFLLAHAVAPMIVAADGGADTLHRWGVAPAAVVGDLDSVKVRPADAVIVEIAEQDTTDLEKCLYSVDAPLFMGVGFLGGRMDHTLAALHALIARPAKRVILIGDEDIVFAAPLRVMLSLTVEARVSIFPMKSVLGRASRGLQWPIDALALEAGVQTATSNRATAPEVVLEFDRHGAVILLEKRFLNAAIDALTGCNPR